MNTMVRTQSALQTSPVPIEPSKRANSMARDIAITGVTEVATLLAGLTVVSFFGRLMGPVLLAEYMLLRRVVAWFQSGVQLGLGIGLPRYVARVQEEKGEPEAYFIAALSAVVLMVGCSVAVLCSAPQQFSAWLFGDRGLSHLIPALSVFALGLAIHASVYGYHRGRLEMGTANTLQICDNAVIPVVLVVGLAAFRSVSLTVIAIGAAVVVCAGTFATRIICRRSRLNAINLRQHVMVLLKYGVPRVPGEFSEAALFAIGPMFLARHIPLSDVTYLLLGTSMLMLAAVTVTPLGIVLLSKLSTMLAQGRLDEVRSPLEALLGAIVDLGTFGSLQMVIFADVLLKLWVGPAYLHNVHVIRLLAFAGPFYVFFVSLRSAIDAASVKPYNARNTISALGLYIVFLFGATMVLPRERLLDATATALVATLGVLALLTSRTLAKLYGVHVPWGKSLKMVFVAASLGGGSAAVRVLLGNRLTLADAIIVEIAVGAIFLLAVRKNGCAWFKYLCGLAPQSAFSEWLRTGDSSSGS